MAMPASPPLVAAYLACLAEERRMSVATIRLHKAALAAIHKAAGHPDPTDNEPVKQIMKGIARAHGKAPEAGTAVNRRGPGRGEGHGKEQEIPGRPGETARSRRSGRPGEPGWTWPCWPPCGTAC